MSSGWLECFGRCPETRASVARPARHHGELQELYTQAAEKYRTCRTTAVMSIPALKALCHQHLTGQPRQLVDQLNHIVALRNGTVDVREEMEGLAHRIFPGMLLQ